MQDRLHELKEKGGKKGKKNDEDDLEAHMLGDAGGDASPFMLEFFQEVGEIKNEMRGIAKNIRSIEEKYSQALNEAKQEKSKEMSREIDELLTETNKSKAIVLRKLESMKKATDEFASSGSGSKTEIRLRANMHGTLSAKFLELMQDYQQIQAEYNSKYKERVRREMKIVRPEATEKEIEEAIQSSEPIFVNDKERENAKKALQFIQDRHKDIIKLEISMNELHQLFVDMALLVHRQGELIDQIEYNVSTAEAYTKQAKKALEETVVLAKKSRKKMYCLIVIFVIIIVVVLWPTLSTQLKTNTNSKSV